MKTKPTTEHLKHILTEDEIKDYGAQLARRYSEITDLEEQKKSVTSDFKARIDSANADAGVLARKIQNGYEFKNTDCEIQWDYDEKAVTVVRLDTMETVKSRPMTPDELQEEMFDGEGQDKDE